MRDLRRLPVGLLVVVAIGIGVALAVGTARPACACVAPPTSPVDGVVIAVNATGLTDVHDFTLQVADAATGGWRIVFLLGPLENATDFSPGHLKAHEASGQPVRVFFTRDQSGQYVVYRLEDAP